MSRARRWLFMGAALGLLLGGRALAQQPSMEDLKQAPASRQVTSVAYCRGEYTVGLSDGSVRKFGSATCASPRTRARSGRPRPRRAGTHGARG